MFKKRYTISGFTLIELILAITIAGIILTPLSIIIFESVTSTFLPEHYQIASSLLEGKLEEATNLRFNDSQLVTQGPISFSGDFSAYSWSMEVGYVQAGDLNTTVGTTTDYKRVQITISHSGFPDVTAVTVITNN